MGFPQAPSIQGTPLGLRQISLPTFPGRKSELSEPPLSRGSRERRMDSLPLCIIGYEQHEGLGPSCVQEECKVKKHFQAVLES